MKTRVAWMSAALAAVAVGGVSRVAEASSHREAPIIATDPSADNTDLYAWVDSSGNLVVIANYIGFEAPDGGPNWSKFSDDVLYEVHIARGGSSLADAITYQIQFTTAPYTRVAEATGMSPGSLTLYPNTKGLEFFGQLSGGGAFNQTYTVTKVIGTGLKVPPPNVGPTTDFVVNGYTISGAAAETYEHHFVDSATTGMIGTLMNGEGLVFAGPRDDPFYADLGAVFDLAQVRPVLGLLGGATLGGAGQQVCTTCAARNSLQYQNVHSIALQIPGAKANGGTAVTAGASVAQTLGIWASASRRKVSVVRTSGPDDHYGPWRQISRIGVPLINETVIGLQDKDYWNRSTPSQDSQVFGAYFDNLIAARDAQAVGYYGASAPLSVCNIASGGPPLTGRLGDITPIINLSAVNAAYDGFTVFGDVLRVDLGLQLQDFPNGRRIIAGSNIESIDIVDTEIKMLFCTLTHAYGGTILSPDHLAPNTPYGGIPDGVSTNETNFRATFPYLAAPWSGFYASPHAAPDGT